MPIAYTSFFVARTFQHAFRNYKYYKNQGDQLLSASSSPVTENWFTSANGKSFIHKNKSKLIKTRRTEEIYRKYKNASSTFSLVLDYQTIWKIYSKQHKIVFI